MKKLREFNEQEIKKFFSRVVKGSVEDDCWRWIGATSHGYAIFKVKFERYRASRVSYFITHGVDPEELFICHKCDNPICTNPNHLFLGDQFVNMNDASIKNRLCVGKDNIMSRLKEEDIPKIKEIYAKGGISQLKLAKQFSVTQATIFRVVRNKCWKHLNNGK